MTREGTEAHVEQVAWLLIVAVGLYGAYRLGVVDGRRDRSGGRR